MEMKDMVKIKINQRKKCYQSLQRRTPQKI